MKFRGISRKYTTRNSAEFRQNFCQFCTEYGIDGSKKNRRNSVSSEFRGHPRNTVILVWHVGWNEADSIVHPETIRPLEPSFLAGLASVAHPELIVTKEINFCTAYKPVFWPPMGISGKAGLNQNSVSHWSDLHTVRNGIIKQHGSLETLIGQMSGFKKFYSFMPRAYGTKPYPLSWTLQFKNDKYR